MKPPVPDTVQRAARLALASLARCYAAPGTRVISLRDMIRERGAQRHRTYRLVQQRVAVRFGLLQRFRIGVAAHQEGRYRSRQRTAQLRDRLDAGFPVAQMIVRNDHVGRLTVFGEAGKRGAVGPPGDDTTAPASEQSAHSLEHERIIVDHDDEFAVGYIEPGKDRSGRFDGLGTSVNHRHGDGEARALAQGGVEFDRVVKEPAQTIDDCQAEPKTAAPVMISFTEAVELAENVLAPVRRNPGSGVPNLDPQPAAAPAAADDQASLAGVADRVGDQIEHDPL